MRVAIVGGALVGLTVGLVLRDIRFEMVINDSSSSEIQQQRVGIGFLPVGYHDLAERVSRSIDRPSVSISGIHYLTHCGTVTHRLLYFNHFSIWNADYRKLLTCFDMACCHLEKEIASFADSGQQVLVSWIEGMATHPNVTEAVAGWEQNRIQIGRQVVAGVRKIGPQSQVGGTSVPSGSESFMGLSRR